MLAQQAKSGNFKPLRKVRGVKGVGVFDAERNGDIDNMYLSIICIYIHTSYHTSYNMFADN